MYSSRASDADPRANCNVATCRRTASVAGLTPARRPPSSARGPEARINKGFVPGSATCGSRGSSLTATSRTDGAWSTAAVGATGSTASAAGGTRCCPLSLSVTTASIPAGANDRASGIRPVAAQPAVANRLTKAIRIGSTLDRSGPHLCIARLSDVSFLPRPCAPGRVRSNDAIDAVKRTSTGRRPMRYCYAGARSRPDSGGSKPWLA